MNLQACLKNLIKQIIDTRALAVPVFIHKGQNADVSAKLMISGPGINPPVFCDTSTRGMLRPDVSETLDGMLELLRTTPTMQLTTAAMCRQDALIDKFSGHKGFRPGGTRRSIRTSGMTIWLAVHCKDPDLSQALADAIAPLIEYILEANPEMVATFQEACNI